MIFLLFVQGNPQLELQEKRIIDSRCSRYMTGNKSYISDYEEIDGGFISFGGNAKGGKITGKGKIRTGKLDFEDVYFVNKLKFNLFSVSQMCDKKNSVLFTDTECVVLSSDFKLTNENHVLLKVPRKDNMYNVDLRNVVPQGGKFDGKADDGFFIGYSVNSKAFRVFNSRTRIPVVVGNQSNGNASTKACDDVGKARVETIPGKNYILLPLWPQDPQFSSSSKDSPDARFKLSGEEEKKEDI
ncbi:ribonuclease H-like domain-containing protein [Tanacetum coccineum]